jgi:hypothetical protein
MVSRRYHTERYVSAESRWEVLSALPVACCAMSIVVLDDSLFAVCGFDKGELDNVQKLSRDKAYQVSSRC